MNLVCAYCGVQFKDQGVSSTREILFFSLVKRAILLLVLLIVIVGLIYMMSR